MRSVKTVDANLLLKELVENYSPSRAEHTAVHYLVRKMVDMGFNAFVDDAGNAVGEMGQGEKTFVLLGHIDTVPGNIPVRQEGNLLFGRGTVDAKGPLAAFTCATARCGPIPGWRIVVIGAVEEEAATSKGARFALQSFQPEAVIIGEPSHWNRVTVGYKGRLLVDYELLRDIGHTAGPEVRACEEAHLFWHSILKYTDAFNVENKRVFEQLTPSLRAMNSVDDGFIQQATLTIGFRIPQQLPIKALEHDLANMAGEARLSFRGQESAIRAPKNTPLARAFIKSVSGEGGRLQFLVKSGTSDMNVVGPIWNVPILAYGPGDSNLDHTPNEHIDLLEYHKAISVLTRVLRDFCK
jgi:LysW-gamma-L-lysine carboxypeptidase